MPHFSAFPGHADVIVYSGQDPSAVTIANLGPNDLRIEAVGFPEPHLILNPGISSTVSSTEVKVRAEVNGQMCHGCYEVT